MTGAKDFIELFLQKGWPVVVAFVLYRIINLVFDWLSRYEAAGLFKAFFNRRRQHLEKMLSQPYLSRETRNLARAELNQMSRRKLTGFSDPHLQEKLTRICLRHNLPSRYFTRWRTYLSEKNGVIVFAGRLYRFVWRFFLFINLPLSTLYLGFMSYVFMQIYGFDKLFIILSLNMLVWYLPWLIMTSPMAPPPTNEMKNYISAYNASSMDKK